MTFHATDANLLHLPNLVTNNYYCICIHEFVRPSARLFVCSPIYRTDPSNECLMTTWAIRRGQLDCTFQKTVRVHFPFMMVVSLNFIFFRLELQEQEGQGSILHYML